VRAAHGAGLGLVAQILTMHETAFVYAGARDPEKAIALEKLRDEYPGRVALVKCVSADSGGNTELAKEIEARHVRVDTVIANAGICKFVGLVNEVSIDDLEEHFHVNVTGTIVLFQSMYYLLKKSANPHFIPVSTVGGRLSGGIIEAPFGNVSYGATKAALNWAARKIHFENPWLTCFPLSPGGVDTDMVQIGFAEDKTGLFEKIVDGNMIEVHAAAAVLVKLINDSTRETHGGEYVDRDGSRLEW